MATEKTPNSADPAQNKPARRTGGWIYGRDAKGRFISKAAAEALAAKAKADFTGAAQNKNQTNNAAFVAGNHPAPPPATPSNPEVYTIDADKSFVTELAKGVLERAGDDPLKLGDYTILVPSRAAARGLRQAFAEILEGRPAIFPVIDTPGDLTGDEISLKTANDPVLSEALMDIPPAVSVLQRKLMLAAEIMKMPNMASSPQKAVKLAAELGNFLDEAQRQNIDLKNLDNLVPDDFKPHWQKTQEFLNIITDVWPQKLQEMGCVDPEERRNLVMMMQALHWQNHPPKRPVIAAGFTDVMPSLAELLKTVAQSPNGMLVMPGVDTKLDDQSWQSLNEVHPQFEMRKLLNHVNVPREEIRQWVSDTPAPAKPVAARAALLREAMRPAATSEGWSKLKAEPQKGRGKKSVNDNANTIAPEALAGLDLITCTTEQEEANVIALKLRETLEVAGRTALLVTPDTSLARRVAAKLRYWEIDVEAGSGQPLADSMTGIWLATTARMAQEELAPVPLLECLQHPLAALGGDKKDFVKTMNLLEDRVLHGPRPESGFDGLKRATTAAFNKVASLGVPKKEFAPDQKRITDLIDRLQKIGGDFVDMMADGKKRPFGDLLDRHIRFVEAMAETPDSKSGADRVWRGDDGAAASRFLSQLRDLSDCLPDMSGAEYTDLLVGLMKSVKVNSTRPHHPQIRIVTPDEARLMKADVMIVGGLNEEKWPGLSDENPWLSRDMVRKLGMQVPENDVGQSAHDFAQFISSQNVLMTRSLRRGGSPAVASPFLTRLSMVLQGAGLFDELESKAQLAAINTALHTPAAVKPIESPSPVPPKSARPKQLPATAIETLIRDPYAVYARYVLKLRAKEPIDAAPSASERGIFIHDALDRFVRENPDKLPKDSYERLIEIGRDTFKKRSDNPLVQAFWWPRFERIAKWFVRFEEDRRRYAKTLATEVRGRLEIDLGSDTFTLTAIADRIDMAADGKMVVMDYKTGGVPTQKDVANGFSPQLTLESVIAFTGGFDGIDAGDVGSLEYLKLSGSRPAGDLTRVRGDVDELAEDALNGLTALAKAFVEEGAPFLSNPRPDLSPRYNNYRHLSRVDEWSNVRHSGPKKMQPGRKGRK